MTDTPEVTTAPQRAKVKSRRGRKIMVLVLVVLLVLMCAGSVLLLSVLGGPGGSRLGVGNTDETGLTWVRSIYGMSEQLDDQFEYVNAAVPAADGSIWVIDVVHRNPMQFTPDGRYIGTLPIPEENPLVTPGRFAFGPDGRMYICETQADTVRVLQPDGTEDGSFLIPRPLSIAMNDEFIVVGSVAGFAILNFDGEPEQVIGSRGKGDDQFDYVHGVAIGEDGTIYVVDAYNCRLSAWDREGTRLWMRRVGIPQNSAEMQGDGLTPQEPEDLKDVPGEERLQLPMGVTIDGAGRVVVVDMFESAIAVFEAEDGAFVGKYGEIGEDDGKFFYPQSIGYDEGRDWFTVADTLNNRAQIVRLPGSAGGLGVVETARRTIAGPLRACLFPLALLLLALIVWFVWSRLRKRRPAQSSPSSGAAAATLSDAPEQGAPPAEVAGLATDEESVKE